MLLDLAGDKWIAALLQALDAPDVPTLERASILLQKLAQTRCVGCGCGCGRGDAIRAGRAALARHSGRYAVQQSLARHAQHAFAVLNLRSVLLALES